jgi:hypothetical protein
MNCTSVFRGTPWYNAMARLCGMDIHPETILFAPIWLVESHLIHLGKGLIDWEAKTVSHFMKNGQYFFKSFNMGDNTWIQTNCRILAPNKVEGGARIMPACTTLPNEEISKGTLWAGIPGGPIGEVLQPSIRSRMHHGAIVSGRHFLTSSRRGLSQRELEQKVAVEKHVDPGPTQKGSLLRRRSNSIAMRNSKLSGRHVNLQKIQEED